MNTATLLLSFALYSLTVLAIKKITFPEEINLPPSYKRPWIKGHEYTLIFSHDFWWAKRFKEKIKQCEEEDNRSDLLKTYIIKNNKVNLWVSGILTATLLITYTIAPSSKFHTVALGILAIRFISRSFEIAYAFIKDVLQNKERTSGLDKFERIKLALISYVEIFMYSAGTYVLLPSSQCWIDPIRSSLNVGTLTNVGLIFSGEHANSPWNLLVFIQVFSTLSLVVLSLASYLSREE